jgi:hypothetical protein
MIWQGQNYLHGSPIDTNEKKGPKQVGTVHTLTSGMVITQKPLMLQCRWMQQTNFSSALVRSNSSFINPAPVHNEFANMYAGDLFFHNGYLYSVHICAITGAPSNPSFLSTSTNPAASRTSLSNLECPTLYWK